jgi:hypothetical protein
MNAGGFFSDARRRILRGGNAWRNFIPPVWASGVYTQTKLGCNRQQNHVEGLRRLYSNKIGLQQAAESCRRRAACIFRKPFPFAFESLPAAIVRAAGINCIPEKIPIFASLIKCSI